MANDFQNFAVVEGLSSPKAKKNNRKSFLSKQKQFEDDEELGQNLKQLPDRLQWYKHFRFSVISFFVSVW